MVSGKVRDSSISTGLSSLVCNGPVFAPVLIHALTASSGHSLSFFTARGNARIASAVLAIAIPSVRLSVRLSARLSVTRRYCVKTTARSTVQFTLLDLSLIHI